jgi:hypothetical protein
MKPDGTFGPIHTIRYTIYIIVYSLTIDNQYRSVPVSAAGLGLDAA